MGSTWVATAGEVRRYPPLSAHLEVDVAVIGSGITGVTCAYLLAKAGKKVGLITKGDLTDSATAYTTGFITGEYDTAFADLEKMHGATHAQLLVRAHMSTVEAIARTVEDERIECEFVRCDQITVARSDAEWKDLAREAQAFRSHGFDVEARQDAGLPFQNAGAMMTHAQAKFHALKYVAALRERARELGALVFDGTEATDIATDGDRRIVAGAEGSLVARDVVIATYYPFTKPKQLFARTGGYITYIIEYAIPKGALPEAMYLDNHNPYHYFRVDAVGGTEDRLIVGGEDHREELSLEDESYRALEAFVEDLLGHIDRREVRRWSGPIIEPIDGLPLIGPLLGDEHQYVATGFSGTGMSLSRLAAEIVSDAILERPNPYAELFKPTRIPTPYQLVKKGKDYVGELAGGALKNWGK